MAVNIPVWARLPLLATAVAALPLSAACDSVLSGERPRTSIRPRTVQQRTFADEAAPSTRSATVPPSAPARPEVTGQIPSSPAPGEFVPWSPGNATSAPVIGLPGQPAPAFGTPWQPFQGSPIMAPLAPGVIDPRPMIGGPGQAIPEYPPYVVPVAPQAPGLAGGSPAIDDGFWIVSTRNCPDGGTAEIAAGCVRVLHHDPTGCLRNADIPQFHTAIDPTRPIVFVIHGSYNYWRDVLNESRSMYRWLSRSGTARPVQMVFFTWPSDGYAPFALPLEVAVLGRRSAAHSVFLAGLIRDLPPGAGLSMIGHSHGARTCLAAAHLLGGGRLENGQCLGEGPASPRALRAVLLAAAVDHQWLNPGERYGAALSSLDRVLVFRNSRDFWLSVYPLRKPFGEPSLSGAGLSPWDRAALGPNAAKVIEYDVTRQLGAGHNLATYYKRASLAQVAGRFATFEDDIGLISPGAIAPPMIVEPGYPLGSTGPAPRQERAVGTAPPAANDSDSGTWSTTRPITPPARKPGRTAPKIDDSDFVPPRLVAPPGEPEPSRTRTESEFEKPSRSEVESPAKLLPRIEDEPIPGKKQPASQRGPRLSPPR
jgi:hypothetical protein